ncbi:beta-propeller fold lactonase family protein [Actinoplanes sp. NPDC051861]|uniref:beta-propeller fold lactonase family protein n=1 Tax=Actinoplanes sp. NPDC051861 TaxID=3155170 RepID=UPI00343E72F1
MSGRRLAVVVTVEHHDDPVLSRFAVPSADVPAFADVLGDGGLGGFEVAFLRDPGVREAFGATKAMFDGRDQDDCVLFYFRGVMLTGPGGGLYLAASDTMMSRPADSSLDVAQIAALLQHSRAGQAVVMLDGRTGGPVDAGHHFRAARVAEWQSRIVIAATARPEPPTFAGLIADGVRSGAADRDRDGFIGIGELHDHLRERDPSVRQWVFGSGRQPYVSRVRRPGSDQMALIAQLAMAAGGADLSRAVEARATLQRLTTGEGRVAAAAAAALRRTSVRLGEPALDFGRVAAGRQVTAEVSVQGPPLAAASAVTSDVEGLHARLEGGVLRVSWFPGSGRLHGTVLLAGPAGSAQLVVTGEVAESAGSVVAGQLPPGPYPAGSPVPYPAGSPVPYSAGSPAEGPYGVGSPADWSQPPTGSPQIARTSPQPWPGAIPVVAGDAAGVVGRPGPFPPGAPGVGDRPAVREDGAAGSPQVARTSPQPWPGPLPAETGAGGSAVAVSGTPVSSPVVPAPRDPVSPAAAGGGEGSWPGSGGWPGSTSGGFGWASTPPAPPPVTPPAPPPVTPPAPPPATPPVTPPAQEHAEPPAQEHVEPPAQEHVEPPAQEHVEPPAQEHVEPPAQEHTEPPAQELAEPLAQEHAELPAQEHAEVPAQEHAEPLVLEHTGPPTQELAEEGEQQVGVGSGDVSRVEAADSPVVEGVNGTVPEGESGSGWDIPRQREEAELNGSSPGGEPVNGRAGEGAQPRVDEADSRPGGEISATGVYSSERPEEAGAPAAAVVGSVRTMETTENEHTRQDETSGGVLSDQVSSAAEQEPSVDESVKDEQQAGVSLPAQRQPVDDWAPAPEAGNLWPGEAPERPEEAGAPEPTAPAVVPPAAPPVAPAVAESATNTGNPWSTSPIRPESSTPEPAPETPVSGSAPGRPVGFWPGTEPGQEPEQTQASITPPTPWPVAGAQPPPWPTAEPTSGAQASAWPSTEPASGAQASAWPSTEPTSGAAQAWPSTETPQSPPPADPWQTTTPISGAGTPQQTPDDWPRASSQRVSGWPATASAWPGGTDWPPAPPATTTPSPPPLEPEPERNRKTGRIAAILLLVLLLAGGTYLGARFALTGNDSKDNNAAPPQPTAAAPTATEPTETAAPTEPTQPTQAAPASIAKPAVVDTFKFGQEPEGVAVAPDNRTVYVADQNSKDVHFIDLESRDIAAVKVANTPRFLAVSEDGSRLYVSMFENNFTGNGLAVIDTGKRSVIKTIRTGPRPFEPAVAPNGQVWLPIHNGARVEIYDPETLTEAGRLSVPPNPHWVTFSPDGKIAYTANHESSQISVVNAEDRIVTRNVKVGRSPHSIAVTPDGRTLIVTNYDLDTVEVFNTADMKRLHKINVGKEPQAVVTSTDGKHAYVVNEGSDNLSVVDLPSGKVVSTVKTGDSPRVIAISPDGLRLYVTDGRGRSVTVLKTTDK